MCYDAGLGETIHAVSHFTEDIAICVHFVTESVFIDDVWWEQLQFHLEVFEAVHWCHQIEILDVDCHELGIGCGDYAVEHEFDSEEISGGCATVIRVVD